MYVWEKIGYTKITTYPIITFKYLSVPFYAILLLAFFEKE